MLGKRVEDLSKAITDLLVRQKQVTVGMPPNNEFTITAPLPEADLRQLIHEVSNIENIIEFDKQSRLIYINLIAILI